jgi:hypothetical protein
VRINKKLDIKKQNAELKLTKSNKIAEHQKKFVKRMEKKELPSLREWVTKQEKLHGEICKKIDVLGH